MQHLFAGIEAFFAWGFRKGGQGAQGRATRTGFHQLGPVYGHAVLPVGTGAFVAGDLWWSGMLRGAVEASFDIISVGPADRDSPRVEVTFAGTVRPLRVSL